MKLQNSFLLFSYYILFFTIWTIFNLKNYTTADGLPNNAVRSLFLDAKNIVDWY
jgi:hypothetical protein